MSALLDRQSRHVAVVVIVTLVIAVPFMVILGTRTWLDSLPVFYPVLAAGTVGGTANNIMRLQRLRLETGDGTVTIDPNLAIAQTYLSPIIGGVFAALLYGVFMSSFLQGDFFPTFNCSADDFRTYKDFSLCDPATNGDAAKAMVWGFVAGFGERFVPNILEGLSNRSGGGD